MTRRRWIVVALAVVALVAVIVSLAASLALLVAVAAGSTPGGAGAARGGTVPGGGTSDGSQPAVPAAWRALYQQAASTCPGLSWSIVAAVGTVESDNGRSTAPGVWSGTNGAGAEGPMQFEPGTFTAYATVGPGGARPPSPYDPVDAVYSATTMLCADGAGAGTTLRSAVEAYDHADTYVDTVLTLASWYGSKS